MPSAQIALLGAVSGLTIFLGLPLGRLRAELPRTKTLLNGTATGILIFLLWDVLAHAWEPVDSALGKGEIGAVLGNGAGLAVTFGVGLLGLVHFDQAAGRTASRQRAFGPGAAAVGELEAPPVRAPGARLAMTIAVGIGLHNFAEGLAIGNSAAAGDLSLAVLLVIGFGLHNATEGFGIVAPLTGSRPSWGYLALLGLIGGGPTFVGTLVGQAVVNDNLSIVFLGLAPPWILYVVV